MPPQSGPPWIHSTGPLNSPTSHWFDPTLELAGSFGSVNITSLGAANLEDRDQCWDTTTSWASDSRRQGWLSTLISPEM